MKVLATGATGTYAGLVSPALVEDDRNAVPDPNIAPYAAWSYDDNITAWQAILGDNAGTDTVPIKAAPSRLTDATGLPPAYIEAGQLDIFRDEDLHYAVTLSARARCRWS
jgi:acetyl esterase/lipase